MTKLSDDHNPALSVSPEILGLVSGPFSDSNHNFLTFFLFFCYDPLHLYLWFLLEQNDLKEEVEFLEQELLQLENEGVSISTVHLLSYY